ncbi:nucleotide exchange factor GrpE [Paenibacillus melissococcoides]|uniref:Protein GrpE n=1 Tax=Paenibacillus melissococcoides TaxID=2912268 RepID=A0ABN8U235_9BACL|nr:MULTISPECIES: nucleotide exchange factor GrpE [Paenibacillus]MEB9897578.1 nucleotide exchange factor GrpE [Bacillus cereus]CAH8245148.1 nucleotide exchange factor GrpE [Paenibacillus melissococcoides]CAH8710112.1 nucleotide exchange factor GrpE [Paenibacillus melissococcoides]CAH8710881.1 nucleotide exchange factor GrpE [Paenibacillus melissococcoides]GIO79791.1 nucleotide exchange factor GrpE [Paenibacillus dendritiformis]
MNPEQEEKIDRNDQVDSEAVEAADVEHKQEAEEASEAEGKAAEEAQGEPAELKEARAQAEELQQRLLRAQADFDNFRRRTVKEKEELAQYASSKLVTQLLPVLDNFERALAAAQTGSEEQSFVKGVDMIFRQFMQVLEQEGVKAMNAVGEPFNPEFHQAIMQVESEEHEEGIVVEEVQKGYMLKDRVLRPAMVKVSG